MNNDNNWKEPRDENTPPKEDRSEWSASHTDKDQEIQYWEKGVAAAGERSRLAQEDEVKKTSDSNSDSDQGHRDPERGYTET